jgi:type VI secretion system FHA domain protein
MSGVPATHLNLVTRRGPAGVATEHHEVTRLPFSIGRAPDNDWVLPDPGRVLSKRHCRIIANGEAWLIIDTSSNGTFLNGTTLEPDVPHALRDGDRVVFGTYEIEACLGEGAPLDGDEASVRDESLHGDAPRGDSLRDERPRDWWPTNESLAEDRLTSDPFPSLDGDVLDAARPSVGLPTDFDPLALAERVTESPYAVPDHVPELEANFRAPRPNLDLLPDDWNQPPEPRPAPEPAPTPEVPVQAAHASAPMPPPAMPPPMPSPAVDTGDAAGFAAFAAGAGMTGASAAEPGTTLAMLGAAFRIVVSGLRRIMIARASIKGEFRIEQTMVRATGNNPLKFSADDDDALAALLGTGRQGGMRPAQALGEAMRDMRRHELAVAAAMQQAVREVLGQLEPSRMMPDEPLGMFDRLTGSHERRAWRRYAARHAGIMRALGDDFDSVFGRSFGRAYEAALVELAAQDEETDP